MNVHEADDGRTLRESCLAIAGRSYAGSCLTLYTQVLQKKLLRRAQAPGELQLPRWGGCLVAVVECTAPTLLGARYLPRYSTEPRPPIPSHSKHQILDAPEICSPASQKSPCLSHGICRRLLSQICSHCAAQVEGYEGVIEAGAATPARVLPVKPSKMPPSKGPTPMQL